MIIPSTSSPIHHWLIISTFYVMKLKNAVIWNKNQSVFDIVRVTWRWRQQGPPKRRYPTAILHGIPTQKTSTRISIPSPKDPPFKRQEGNLNTSRNEYVEMASRLTLMTNGRDWLVWRTVRLYPQEESLVTNSLISEPPALSHTFPLTSILILYLVSLVFHVENFLQAFSPKSWRSSLFP